MSDELSFETPPAAAALSGDHMVASDLQRDARLSHGG